MLILILRLFLNLNDFRDSFPSNTFLFVVHIVFSAYKRTYWSVSLKRFTAVNDKMGGSWGGDVAQWVDRRTGTPLTQVRFSGAATVQPPPPLRPLPVGNRLH